MVEGWLLHALLWACWLCCIVVVLLSCCDACPSPAVLSTSPSRHPVAVLQAWLASRGPLLQQLAVQQHLWGEVAAAVQVCWPPAPAAFSLCFAGFPPPR